MGYSPLSLLCTLAFVVDLGGHEHLHPGICALSGKMIEGHGQKNRVSAAALIQLMASLTHIFF